MRGESHHRRDGVLETPSVPQATAHASQLGFTHFIGWRFVVTSVAVSRKENEIIETYLGDKEDFGSRTVVGKRKK